MKSNKNNSWKAGLFLPVCLMSIFIISMGSNQIKSQVPFGQIQYLDGEEFLLNPAQSFEIAEGWEPKAAYGNGQILIVWEDSWRNCLMGARVIPEGNLMDSAGIYIPNSYNSSSYSVAFDGTNYMVVWNIDDENEKEIYGARISEEGDVLDQGAIEIMVGEGNDRYPRVAFNGTNYLAAWKNEGPGGSENIYAKRISPEGVVLDTDRIEICTFDGEQDRVAVAGYNDGFFVVWNDRRNNNIRDVYGARLDNEGNVLDADGFVIKSSDEDHWDPEVDFDGENFLVVWDEDSGFDVTGIFGARVDTSGTVMDPGGFTICDVNSYQETPDLAFDGTNYIVGWNDYRNDPNGDPYFARVSTDAQLLDPDGIALSTTYFYSYYINLVASNNEIFAIWEANWSSYVGWASIFGTPISSDGTVQIPDGTEYNFITNSEREPAVAFDGSNYLFVWQHDSGESSDIFGARVDPSGNVMSPGVFVISDAEEDQKDPDLAYDGTNFLVVWEDYRDYYQDYLYCSFVTIDGVVLNDEGIMLAGSGDGIEEPVLAYDGDNYMVVCEKYHSGVKNILGMFVSTDGVIQGNQFYLSNSPEWQERPDIAFNGDHYMVIWGEDNSAQNAYNIYGQRIATDATILDPVPFQISDGDCYRSSLIAHANDFVAVWEDESGDDYDIYGARITGDGIVVDPGGFLISGETGNQLDPAIEWDGVEYLVVWEDGRFDQGSWNNYDLYGTYVSTEATVGTDFMVTEQYRSQWDPAFASGPGNQVMMAYYGWTTEEDAFNYNAERVWGKVIEHPQGIRKSDISDTYRIYPNPANNQLHIVSNDARQKIHEISIWNITGQKSMKNYSMELCSGTCILDISDLKPGYYMLSVRGDKEWVVTKLLKY